MPKLNEDRRLAAIYESLRERILDLSLRNPMLSYKHRASSKRQLQIVDAVPEEVYRKLVGESASLELLPLPDLEDIPRDERTEEFISALEHAKASDIEYLTRLKALANSGRDDEFAVAEAERELRDRLRKTFDLPPRPTQKTTNPADHARKKGIDPSIELQPKPIKPEHSATRLQTLKWNDTLNAVIEKIADSAKLAEQEMGLSTLFLAFGFLEWYETTDSSKKNFAPLLLLPVAINKRKTTRGKHIYSIVALAEGADTNLSLRKRLHRDFNRTLPEFQEDDDIMGSVEEYFRTTASSVKGLANWKLHRWITLGHFSFGRFAMYADLEPENWNVHPVKDHLVNSILAGTEMDGDAGTLLLSPPDDYPIDEPEIERVAPILIHDADASQHSALVDVMKGKNLVIQGPPGTGKSQTITNIIANALSKNMTVLFLADKQAALEVVKRRLDKAGLGAFCLELHSGKASSREVVESLKARHKLGYRIPSRASTSNDVTWEKTRRDITEYLSALHTPRTDGETPFSLFWHSIRAHTVLGDAFKTFKANGFPVHFIERPHEFAGIKGEISLYSRMLEHFALMFGKPVSSPWTALNFGDKIGPGNATGLLEDLTRLHERASKVASILQGASGLAIKDVVGLERLIELDANLPLDVPDPDVVARISNVALEDVESLIAARLAFQEAEGLRAATAAFAETLGRGLPPDLTEVDEVRLHLIEQLNKVASKTGISDKTPTEIKQIAKKEIENSRTLKHLIEKFQPGIEILELGELCPANALETIYVAITIARQLSGEVLPWYRWTPPGGIQTFEDAYSKWLRLSESEAQWRARFPGVGKDTWPIPEELAAVANILRKPTLQKALGAMTGDRKVIDGLSHKLGFPPTVRPKPEDLEELARHVRECSAFIQNTAYRDMLGAVWQGFDTPFKTIAKILSFRQKAEDLLLERSRGADVVAVIRTLDAHNIKQLSALAPAAEALKRLPSEIRAHLDERPLKNVLREIEENEKKAAHILQFDPDGSLLGMERPIEALAEIAHTELNRRTAESRLRSHSLWSTHGNLVNGREEVACLHDAMIWYRTVKNCETTTVVSESLFSKSAREMRRRLFELAVSSKDALAELRRSVAEIEATHDVTGFNATSPPELVENLETLLPRRGELVELLAIREQRRILEAHGFGIFLELFDRSGLPPKELVDLAVGLLAYWRAERLRRTDSVLSRVNGMKLGATRREFTGRDRAKLQMDRSLVFKTLITKEPTSGNRQGPKKTWTELDLLNNEFGKERRFTAVRELIRRAPTSIQTLKPCFMMSPISLAKFLPSNVVKFDLLVVDEASQMRPQEALGGLLRADQVIVVGDQKQLPPTDFFARSDEIDEELDDVDDESILEACQKSFRQVRILKWHYRSRCESLIAFSNKEFYRGELITFPTAKPHSFSINIVRAAGYYEARRNLVEAQRIAEESIQFMRHFSDLDEESIPTLGIVAVNITQRDLIFEELRHLEAGDELVERYRTKVAAKGEPVFVKNLENVQGDERDFIFISMTYGPAPRTKEVLQRFGPINGKYGHRRLNVLFTRARMRVIVFTSMTAADIRPSDTSHEGVKVLKRYLEYAETRGKATVENLGDQPDSDFEAEVADRLRSAGFDVELQVGVSGFKIDIGVRHPDYPTKFVAGIECDGAAYHSSKSARDRDRLREEVLRGLGWDIVRVWSTDWFDNPQLQSERLVKELNELCKRPILHHDDYVVASSSDMNVVTENSSKSGGPIDSIDMGDRMEAHSIGGSNNSSQPSLESTFNGSGPLTALQVAQALRDFRRTVIATEMDGWEEHRSILRDALIETFIAQRVTDPEDWFRKVPQFQRSATNAVEKSRYLDAVCEIVSRLDARA